MNELDALRSFRSSIAEPPPGMELRIEQRLLEQQRAERAGAATDAISAPPLRVSERFTTARQGRAQTLAAALRGRSGARRRQGRWGMPVARRAAMAFGTIAIAASVSASGLGTGTQGGGPTIAAASILNGAAQTTFNRYVLDQPGFHLPADASRSYPIVPTRNGEPSLLEAGPAAMTAEQISSLPTDERELLQLMRRATAERYAADPDFGPFRVSVYYLADAEVPPRVRATFFRMLALTEGIEHGGTAVDVLGRKGVVVARLDRVNGVRQQYLIDPSTAQLLEHREFSTRAQLGTCPVGTVITLGVFADDGRQLTEAEHPYARWPAREPGCMGGGAPGSTTAQMTASTS